MEANVISKIEEQLRQLSEEKLEVVSDFVSYLLEKQRSPKSTETALLSEHVLRRDWDRPEEDEAWADL